MTDLDLLERARQAKAQQVAGQKLIDDLPRLEKEAKQEQQVTIAKNKLADLQPVLDGAISELQSKRAARDAKIKLLSIELEKLINECRQYGQFADHVFGQIKNLTMLNYIAKSESYNGDDVQSLSEQFMIDRQMWPMSKFSGSVARDSSLSKVLGMLG